MGTILTPIMTSNNTPSGEVKASSIYADRAPWHAFTQTLGDIDSNWVAAEPGNGEWIQYKFDSPKLVNSVDFYNRNYADGYYPLQVTLKASNDENNWIVLGTYTDFNAGAGTKTTLATENKTRYLYYRLIFDQMHANSDGYAGASRIDLMYVKPEVKYFSSANVNYLLSELAQRIKESHINE